MYKGISRVDRTNLKNSRSTCYVSAFKLLALERKSFLYLKYDWVNAIKWGNTIFGNGVRWKRET